jgi:hypothetical protein
MSISLFGLSEYEYIDYKDLVKLRSLAAAYRRKIRELGRNSGTEEGLERTRCAYLRQLEKMYRSVLVNNVLNSDHIDNTYTAPSTAVEVDGDVTKLYNSNILTHHQLTVNDFGKGKLISVDIPFKVHGVIDFTVNHHSDDYTGYISVRMLGVLNVKGYYKDALNAYKSGSVSAIGSYLKHIHEVDCLNIFDIPDIFTFVGEEGYEKITALCDPLYAYFMINDFTIKYEDIGK